MSEQEHYIKILNRKQKMKAKVYWNKQIRDRLAEVITKYKHDIRTWVSSGDDQDHIQHELGYIRALYFALGRESCKELTWIEKWEERI
tara:strand:+ start:247 stop:510 length:264 start_codon:yes stop_codon:yes gene_type:complete